MVVWCVYFDVFSELDGARRRALTTYLQNHQTFITTTDADIVVQHFMDKCHVIPTYTKLINDIGALSTDLR